MFKKIFPLLLVNIRRDNLLEHLMFQARQAVLGLVGSFGIPLSEEDVASYLV